jgi:hypothetical protein
MDFEPATKGNNKQSRGATMEKVGVVSSSCQPPFPDKTRQEKH